mgnify:CR=1 FL=1
MGFTNKFAESFARSKTMTGPEKRANEIMGKLLLKKAIAPIILMVIVLIVGLIANISGWAILLVNILIAVGTYFYIKNSSKKYQNFKPYVGNLINLEKKGKNDYVAIIKQGKLPVKLQIAHGGEDCENLKKKHMKNHII